MAEFSLDLKSLPIKDVAVSQLGELVLRLADGSEIPFGCLPACAVPERFFVNDLEIPVVWA